MKIIFGFLLLKSFKNFSNKKKFLCGKINLSSESDKLKSFKQKLLISFFCSSEISFKTNKNFFNKIFKITM